MQSCWITGASSGIGRATSIAFVKRGHTVIASSRSLKDLIFLKKECNDLSYSGKIIPLPMDVTNVNDITKSIKYIKENIKTLDYVLLNAGTYIKEDSKNSTLQNTKIMIDLNFTAVLNNIILLQPFFTILNIKQIAVVSSMAAWRGMPMAAAYCSSKAAIKTAIESFEIDYSQTNVRFRLFYPGFVETPLTNKNNFKMPFIIKADQAAEKIYNSIKYSRKFETSFPISLALIMKIISVLPWPLYRWLMLKKLKK